MDPIQRQEEEAVSPEFLEANSDKNETGPKDLAEVLGLASAFKTVRRDCSRSSQGIGESLDSVLSKDLSRRLKSITLIPSKCRASVIAHTPTRSHRTSTPSNSPPPPPLPPRSCQSLGPICLPRPRSCSPSCSDLSSIRGDVFSDSEIFDDSKIPLIRSAPGAPVTFKIPEICVDRIMETTEEIIFDKNKNLVFEIADFDVQDVSSM